MSADVQDTNATLSASVDALLDVAANLDEEKVNVQKRIAANRDMLRGFITQGIASAEQVKEIEEFYPKRAENKSKDEAPAEPDPKPAPAKKP